MIVQIYEIQTPEEAEKCIALGVDHIGSVLLSGEQWRHSLIRDVIRLSDGTGVKSSLIPLFGDLDTLCSALDYYRPHFLHFCDSLTDDLGRETDLSGLIELQQRLKVRFPEIKIIRSIPVPPEGLAPSFPTLHLARAMEPASDLFLIDTWTGNEPVKGYIGITGKPAGWEKARELVVQSDIPVILAGGLSPGNVYDAVLKVIPAGADSCTHTNSVDSTGRPIRFKKDFRKVENFVIEVRRAEHAFQSRKEELRKRLTALEEELSEREAALPPHSIRPQQIIAIEALEDEIAGVKNKLDQVEDHHETDL
jgi:phosphoribosylanthranilate isomerase